MIFIPSFTLTVSAAETTTTEKNITLGTTALEGGQASYIYFGNYYQSDANGQTKDPIKWRVLSNADGKLFLLSDQNLDVFEYHKEYEAVTWETSTMRSWLNGLANNKGNGENAIDYTNDNFLDTAFSASEQTAIEDTTVVNNDNPSHGTEGGNNTTDKVFLLSIEEAQNTAYGFTNNKNSTDTRKATNTAYVADGGKIGGRMNGVGKADCWWPRSPGFRTDYAAYVSSDGRVAVGGLGVNNNNYAVRPAFNINLSSVLFTSAASGGKPTGTGLTATTAYTGNEYKLTVKDDSRSGFTAQIGKSADKYSVIYSGAKTGDNEYISAIVKSNDGNITHYGRIAKVTGESGVCEIDLSGVDLTNSTLYIFNEQCNGDYKTDYASELKATYIVTAKTYTVAVDEDITNGTVEANVSEAAEGDTVTLTVTPADNYKIDTVTYNDGTNDVEITATEGVYSFTMPASDVTVSATFKRVYKIIIADNIQNGTLTADKSVAAEGERVTLTATPNEGYEKGQYTTTVTGNVSISLSGDVMTMPACDVIVSIKFVSTDGYKILKSANVGSTVACTYDTYPIPKGGSYTVKVTVWDGYVRGENYSVVINGKDVTNENDVYVVENVTEDQTVFVYNVFPDPKNTAFNNSGNYPFTFVCGDDETHNANAPYFDASYAELGDMTGSMGAGVYRIVTYRVKDYFEDKLSDTHVAVEELPETAEFKARWDVTTKKWKYENAATEYDVSCAAATHTVTFNANGGTVTPASATTGTNGRLASLPTPIREGFTFNGWFDAAENGNAVTADTVYNSDTTIYAQWRVAYWTDEGNYDLSWYNDPNAYIYTISDGADLAGLAVLVNGMHGQTATTFAGKTINIGAKIDLSAYFWKPIGCDSDHYFSGTLNGSNQTITGMMVNETNAEFNGVGLFGCANGMIRDLTVTNSTVVSDGYHTGGIVGCLENTTLLNCSYSGTVTGFSIVGGLVGTPYNSNVHKCTNYATVTVTGTDGKAGGIAGDSLGYIDNCANFGEIKGTNTIGGVAGRISSGSVKNSYSIGAVSATSGDYVGGIAAYVNPPSYGVSDVKNCYYLDSTATAGLSSANETFKAGVFAKTANEFASGEVAYLLNGSVGGGSNWYQNLDNGQTADTYPVLLSTHGKVYRTTVYTECDKSDAPTIKYSNTDSDEVVPAHEYQYEAEDNVITETCKNCDTHMETATLKLDVSANLVYSPGVEHKPASVEYSDGWQGDKLIVTYKDNVNAGTNTASATIVKDTATAKLNFSIKKATPEYTPPAELTAVWGQTLADVEGLTSGFTFMDDLTTSVGNAGDNTFLLKFTPDDENNYTVIENIEVTISVAPQKITKPAVDTTVFTYNGASQTYGVTGTDDYTVTNGTQTAANEDGYTVIISLKDKDNTVWKDGTVANLTHKFIINRKAIETVVGVTAPVAAQTAQTTVSGENYSGTVKWNPDATTFGYYTAYTATVTLTADTNYKFADSITLKDYEVSVSTNGNTLTLTRTFEKTAKAKITSVTAPTVENLAVYGTLNDALNAMPKTIEIETEAGKTTLPITWEIVGEYDQTPEVTNTFKWTANVGDYDVNGKTTSGTLYVANADVLGVSNIGTPAEITYNGNPFDVSTMFTKDTNAGEASYEIVVLGTEGEGTATLGEDGKTLTITKAGVITVKMTTRAVGAYAEGSAQTTLTVKLGTGVGDVTIEGWTYGEDAKTPVVTSETNGTDNVTYLYESTDGKGYNSSAAPTTAGAYKVTATFAATDLYAKTEDSAEFTIEKAEPTVKTAPSATRIKRGKKLEASTIRGGKMIGVDGNALEGTFTWKAPKTVMDTKGDIDVVVVFTPNDTTNYKAVEITISVEVYHNMLIIVTPTYYDVTFDTNDAGTIAKQTVRKNSTATEPAAPTKDGYTFGGWYTDEECTKVYDFDTEVTKDITLYAKWTENKPATPEVTEPCNGTAADNCPSLAFSDLDTTQWYHTGVDYVLNEGMMNGMGGGIFAPNGNLSRAMLVTILWRLEGKPAVNYAMTFEDVDAESWYTEAVRWAASEEIVLGYDAESFGPNDNITREQLATILYRYEQYKGGGFVGAWMFRMDYVDLADVSDWAYEAMCWMNMNGIVNGKPGKILDPKGTATRAEAAAMLNRYCEKEDNE